MKDKHDTTSNWKHNDDIQAIHENIRRLGIQAETAYYTEKKDEVFDTGSRRDSSDHKPRICDLKAYTRERFGYHMLKGSINYGTGNFEKGQPDERTWESIHRHIAKHELGDRSEDHLSAIKFGVQNLMLNEQKAGVPTDFYYQQYVASGEYEKDLARRDAREKKEREVMLKVMMDKL